MPEPRRNSGDTALKRLRFAIGMYWKRREGDPFGIFRVLGGHFVRINWRNFGQLGLQTQLGCTFLLISFRATNGEQPPRRRGPGSANTHDVSKSLSRRAVFLSVSVGQGRPTLLHRNLSTTLLPGARVVVRDNAVGRVQLHLSRIQRPRSRQAPERGRESQTRGC